MTDFKKELQALRQRHEMTQIELTDLKENNERLKKLNQTLLENISSDQNFHQIKLIVQGSFENRRIIELQNQIDKLNKNMNDIVQQRVKEITGNVKVECQNCLKECERCKKLDKIIEDKDELIDALRLEIEQIKANFQIMNAKKRSVPHQKIAELQRVNEILTENLQSLQQEQNNMMDLNQHELQMDTLNKNWETKYENLYQQHQLALDQIQQFCRAREQGGVQTDNSFYAELNRESRNDKQNMMRKKIQQMAGQIAAKKNSRQALTPKSIKPNSYSRILGDSDFANFSIKDAINRPNQGAFF